MKALSIFLIMVPFFSLYAEEAIHLKLSPSIEVSPKHNYFLYDVVEGGKATEHLKDIALPWKVPQKLTREEIFSHLKGVLSQTGQTYSLDIPSQVEFVVSESSISSKEMERKIRNHLTSQCSDCRFQVKLSRLPDLKSRDWTVDFSSLKVKGSFTLPISVSGFWVAGMVRTERPVLVLKKPLRRDEKITKDHVGTELKDITFINDSLSSADEIMDMKARRDLAVGTLVQLQNLVREPAALRGQTVKVITGNALIEISTQGVAGAQGFIGDVIPLKLMDSKRTVTGEIVDKGLVKIQ